MTHIVAWEYANQYDNKFLTHSDPNKWHPHDQAGFKDFRPLVYANDSQNGLLAYLEGQKFHPSASHVSPEYRDGYNRALEVVIDRVRYEQTL